MDGCLKKTSLTSTYPNGLSLSMHTSLHWSVKRTSFNLLLIIEFTSCRLWRKKNRVAGWAVGKHWISLENWERCENLKNYLQYQTSAHKLRIGRKALTRWCTCLCFHHPRSTPAEQWCRQEAQRSPHSRWWCELWWRRKTTKSSFKWFTDLVSFHNRCYIWHWIIIHRFKFLHPLESGVIPLRESWRNSGCVLKIRCLNCLRTRGDGSLLRHECQDTHGDEETYRKSSTVWRCVSAVPATDRALCAWGIRWAGTGLLAGGWGTEAALTGWWWPAPLGPDFTLGAGVSPVGLTGAGREGLGRLAAIPSGVLSSLSAGGTGSVLGSEMSTELSTLGLLWGLRGLWGTAGWPLLESAFGFIVFDDTDKGSVPLFVLSSGVWLWLGLFWSMISATGKI